MVKRYMHGTNLRERLQERLQLKGDSAENTSHQEIPLGFLEVSWRAIGLQQRLVEEPLGSDNI